MPDLSPSEFVARQGDGAPVLDVRTPDEFARGHLAGATLADLSDLGFLDRVRSLGLPAEAPVYVYCHSGARSEQAAEVLRRLGHQGAVNAGGLVALVQAGAALA